MPPTNLPAARRRRLNWLRTRRIARRVQLHWLLTAARAELRWQRASVIGGAS